MDPVTTATMTTILNDIGSVLTEGLKWVGSVATTVTANPLLMFVTVVGFVPLGITMFKSLFHS